MTHQHEHHADEGRRRTRGRPARARWGDPERWWTGDDRWFGPASRRRRGAIRLSILLVLADKPMHGYQIMQELAERSGGAWRPSPGAVYPTLQRLEDAGLIRGEDTSDDRRVYGLTPTAYREAHPPLQRARVPTCVLQAYARPHSSSFREDSRAA